MVNVTENEKLKDKSGGEKREKGELGARGRHLDSFLQRHSKSV
jgi:hypothetical protein